MSRSKDRAARISKAYSTESDPKYLRYIDIKWKPKVLFQRMAAALATYHELLVKDEKKGYLLGINNESGRLLELTVLTRGKDKRRRVHTDFKLVAKATDDDTLEGYMDDFNRMRKFLAPAEGINQWGTFVDPSTAPEDIENPPFKEPKRSLIPTWIRRPSNPDFAPDTADPGVGE